MKSATSISPLRTALAAFIALPFLFPFIFLIGTAMRTGADYAANPGGMPRQFTFEHLAHAWIEANLDRALFVSLAMSFIACLVCLGAALPAAFWFRMNRGRGAGILRNTLIGGYAIPMIVWLIPLFVILSRMGLTGNYAVAGVLNGVASVPFAIYFLYTYFLLVVSDDMLDASALDGAGANQRFLRIGVPMAGPAIASIMALVFVWTSGEILIAATLLQSNPESFSLPLAATTLTTRQSVNLQGQAAAALVSLAPVILIFALAQRHLVAGFGGMSEK